MQCMFLRAPYAVIKRERDLTELQYHFRNWYHFCWVCGDNICEQHIHNLDVGNWVMQDYPVRANGMGGREVRKGPQYGEIFDHHFVEFTYPDSVTRWEATVRAARTEGGLAP